MKTADDILKFIIISFSWKTRQMIHISDSHEMSSLIFLVKNILKCLLQFWMVLNFYLSGLIQQMTNWWYLCTPHSSPSPPPPFEEMERAYSVTPVCPSASCISNLCFKFFRWVHLSFDTFLVFLYFSEERIWHFMQIISLCCLLKIIPSMLSVMG